MKRHLHLGLGRFHRSHQAFYLQRAGLPITAFSMRSPREADALREAGHRYRLIVVGEGQRTEHEISIIDEALFLGRHPERFYELMADPLVRTVTLTITEKGYLEESVLRYLVRGIRERQRRHEHPLHILSCDNLTSNGRYLEKLCQDWSKASKQPYDRTLVTFPNTMVDRIVPAGPDPLEIKTELFHQWLIEDNFLGHTPDWGQEGLFFVDRVEPFEKMKLSLLNASHSLLAYYGQLKGFEFVHQAILDPEIRAMVQRLCLEEVGPCLEIPPPLTLAGYVEDMLNRFHNPELPHRLSQIAVDGSQKVPHRFLPFWEESSVLKTALSAWFTYYWWALKEERFVVSDPLSARLAEQLEPDFRRTVERWYGVLGWPPHPVQFIG